MVSVDAVHPEHQSRLAHGWFCQHQHAAVLATSGRQRLNIHAALELDEMRLVPVEGERINAETTLGLFQTLERSWPGRGAFTCFLTIPATIMPGC